MTNLCQHCGGTGQLEDTEGLIWDCYGCKTSKVILKGRLLPHKNDCYCSLCAEDACPYGDLLHFHHDGCPSCSMN